MICPNCDTRIKLPLLGTCEVMPDRETQDQRGTDIAHGNCPECGHLIVVLRYGKYEDQGRDYHTDLKLVEVLTLEIIYPRKQVTRNVPPEVPESYKRDFLEACEVLPISPKASAALSRRILQQTLREHFRIKPGRLADEIEAFLEQPGIPAFIHESLEPIRQIGNFAAHPLKDTQTGQIVDVEPGEAEWLLDALDSLFDFAFVQPNRLAVRKAALNSKLASLGKPKLAR